MSGPPGFVHRYVPGESGRTLLLLHGTGGNENDLLPLGRELDPRAALLSPRGKVLENGMPRFFRRLTEGIFDEEDLVRRAHELADFVEDAANHHGLERRRIFAAGYSNGANIAGALLLLRPEVLGGAVLLRPMVPLVPKALPDLDGLPVLVCSGKQDPIVPNGNTRELIALLRRAGADVAVHTENTGHGLTPATISAARDWLARRLE